MKGEPAERTGATFSGDRRFRYSLWREWGGDTGRVLFVMLNPSIADEVLDDPTQRRCRRFAKDLGFGGYKAANIFAYVSTDPTELRNVSDPVGPENDSYLKALHEECNLTIAAWGTWGRVLDRGARVAGMLSSIKPLMCLGQNKDGSPKHPLYLRADLKPIPYRLGLVRS